ncbi:hypothetical protein WALSEDRAFT_28916 [Wallemia mellicola CBS 633.66]|uniref:DH domain-containing protein n=1 Tax=Wallemia mellicola (strain ATCC MYA-4683 / CBS 633.66) TaxID=671144 RepID=I4YBD6_WALMC|nr:hypothetical protein WALSEDRAFT_28916 [Wallemia mellicola CBS 633.66]EIM21278.1 hypothetical protein WALSEDRAFT_28916 [Wallemia mellicola CBS 633.66]|eukprot:XP_006958631.1 hypothetical protein WALSEDRAFT_28916 [Wallemia mellicola CBS 633.66]
MGDVKNAIDNTPFIPISQLTINSDNNRLDINAHSNMSKQPRKSFSEAYDNKYKSPFKPFKKISNFFNNSSSTTDKDVFAETERSKALYPDLLRRAKSLDHNQSKQLKQQKQEKQEKLMRTHSRVRNKLRKTPKQETEQQDNDTNSKDKLRKRSTRRSKRKELEQSDEIHASSQIPSVPPVPPIPPVPRIPTPKSSTPSSTTFPSNSVTFTPFPGSHIHSRPSPPPRLDIPKISPFAQTLDFVSPQQNLEHSQAQYIRNNQRRDPRSPTHMLGVSSSSDHSSPTVATNSGPPTPMSNLTNLSNFSNRPQTLHLITDDNLFYEALKDYRKRSIVFGTAESDVVASLGGKSNDKHVRTPSPSPTKSNFEDIPANEDQIMSDPAWKSEVKRLFIIREIASTERSYAKYLSQLLELIKTSYPTFQTRPSTTLQIIDENGSKNPEESFKHIKLLAKHLPELIQVSQQLLQRLDDDPSAYGVAVAFISLETDLESVFINWSRAYPHVIDSISQNKLLREQKEKRNKRGKSMSFVESNKSQHSDFYLQSPHDKVESYTITKKGRVKTEPTRTTNEKSLTKKKRKQAIEESLERLTLNDSQVHQRLKLNDVAVMPSQRVTRYVLLLKGKVKLLDLSKHTPESALASGLVDRALRGAQRIANDCNEASARQNI